MCGEILSNVGTSQGYLPLCSIYEEPLNNWRKLSHLIKIKTRVTTLQTINKIGILLDYFVFRSYFLKCLCNLHFLQS